jgi:hypothetical protein
MNTSNTPVENPQGCAHDWEDATTLQSRRRARHCLHCGRIEGYGGFIGERERNEAMAEAAALRAQRMAGEPGYFTDEDDML